MQKTYDVTITVNIAVEATDEDDAVAQALQYAQEEDLGFVASTHVIEL